MKYTGKPNYLRRMIGIIVCGSPIILFAVSLIFGLFHFRTPNPTGVGLIAGSIFISIFNFYLSFVREFIYRLCHGSMDGYRFISGIPLIATFSAVVGGILSFGSVLAPVLGLTTIAFDTGGLFGFMIFTWRDSSFWDWERRQ